MVSVALGMGDAQGSQNSQVLQQGNGTDIGQVLSRQHVGPVRILVAQLLQAAQIGHALEHTLAVLVACALVPVCEGLGQTADIPVRFVDDHRWMVFPRPQHFGGLRIQGDVPVQRLLDKLQAAPERLQGRVQGQGLPERSERPEVQVLLVAVQCVTGIGPQGAQQGGNPPEPIQVLLGLAADLDLEPPHPVHPHNRFQGLGQAIAQPFLLWNVDFRQRIPQPHGVAGLQDPQRLAGQNPVRCGPAQRGVEIVRLEPEPVSPQGVGQGLAATAAYPVQQGPFDQACTQIGQQSGCSAAAGLLGPGLVNAAPQRKRGGLPARRPGSNDGPLNLGQHVPNVVRIGRIRLLGEPLGHQAFGSQAARPAAVRLEFKFHDQVRNPRHGCDAVAKRHARPDVPDPQGVVDDPHTHGDTCIV